MFGQDEKEELFRVHISASTSLTNKIVDSYLCWGMHSSMRFYLSNSSRLTSFTDINELQSWTKLVETKAISARISQFPCMKTPTR